MSELTDNIRRKMIENDVPARDLYAEKVKGGPTWDTAALQAEFIVEGFAAPFVVVRRKADNVLGSLEFTHNPRVYFNFQPDDS